VNGSFPDEMSAEELGAYKRAAKEALRKRLAALRRSLSADARTERAHRACAALSAEPMFLQARSVLAYAPLRFELDPGTLLEQAWAQGKTVALPRVIPDTGELALHAYRLGDDLEESGFGVREPLSSAPEIQPDAIDLVLVPGLSFDARGFRLGYGKGFYDRLLPRLPRARRVGLAFELSLLPEIPNEAHDEPVACVVTERRVLHVQGSLP
jgi:5-formyltetrahydrofolate cyclo-ligase